MNAFAPICLFTYNRLYETRKTLKALQKNYLAPKSDLIIFSDGPKNERDADKIQSVRNYLNALTGFKSIQLHTSEHNVGLANTIISGVSQVVEEYGKIIVLEDDLVTSPNFLDFLNQALDFYSNAQKIHSISGYTLSLPHLKVYNKDYYLSYRASSWGWGTWLDRWRGVDWQIKDYKAFKWNALRQKKFMRGGSDLPCMLRRQMRGKLDTWDIQWCYHQFVHDLYAVFPVTSKLISIGFGEDATHTKNGKRFETKLDDGHQRIFIFDQTLQFNNTLRKQFKKKFSFLTRLRNKLELWKPKSFLRKTFYIH